MYERLYNKVLSSPEQKLRAIEEGVEKRVAAAETAGLAEAEQMRAWMQLREQGRRAEQDAEHDVRSRARLFPMM